MSSLKIKMPPVSVQYSLAFCFIVFFFPLISLLNATLGIRSNFISIAYRGAALLISLIIIGKEGLFERNYTLSKGLFFLLCFWCYYLIKLVIDLYYFGLVPDMGELSHSKTYYILQTVGMCFIPVIAAYKIAGRIDPAVLHKHLVILLVMINALLVVSFITQYGFDIAKYSSNRISLFTASGDAQKLNPITISMYAGFLIISLLYIKFSYLVKIPLLVLALVNMTLSASIGPVLGVAIIVLIKIYFNWKTMKMLNFLVFFTLIAVAAGLIISNISEEFFLVKRLMAINSNESALIRVESIGLAFDQIKSNVLLGTHFFTTVNSSSPHNIFIDILLSTGLFGMALVLYPIMKFLYYFIKDNGGTLIYSIAFFAFVLAQTSGYVFGLLEFWPIFALCLGLIAKTAVAVENTFEQIPIPEEN